MDFKIQSILTALSVITFLGFITGQLAYKYEGASIVFKIFSIFCAIVFSSSTAYLIVEFVL